MSTILDSLVKSSDKRNKSSTDSMDSFSFSNNNKPAKLGYLFIVIIVFIMLLAVVYWGYTSLDNSAEVAANSDTNEVKQPKPFNAEQNQNNGIREDGDRDENGRRASSSRTAKPESKSVRDKIRRIRAQKEQQNRQQRLSNLDNQKTTATNNDDDDIDRKEVNTQQQQQRRDEIRQKMLAESMAKSQSEKKQKPKPTIPKQDYLLIYQLPFTIRKDLPELKLNIHVYDEKPENRLAIINGVRFQIDDMLDGQVLIKDIVKSGVLFEFNGKEFLVPK